MTQLRNLLIVVIIVAIIVCITQIGLGFILRDSFFERGNNHSVINPIAYSLINGDGFSLSSGNPTIEHEFLYPVLVGGCYAIFGINWFGVTLLHSILFVVTALLVFFIALKIFNNTIIAVISFILTLFHPYLFIHALSISDTIVVTFLLILSVWLTIRVSLKPSILKGMYLGISLGLLILTRDSAVILIIAFVDFLIMALKMKKRILVMLAIIITVLILITPWIVRNYIVSQRVMLSSHGYEVLWQGNNSRTWEYVANDRSVDEIPKPDSILTLRQESPQRTISLTLKENDVYMQEIKKFVLKNPIEIIKLMVLKLVKFWSWKYNPIPSTVKYISVGVRSLIYNIYFFPVLCFAFIGLLLVLSINKQFSIFGLLIFMLYTMIHMLSVGFTRLRLPLDPIISIFAGVGVVVVFDIIKRVVGKK